MTEPQPLDPRIRWVWTLGALIPAVIFGLVAGGLAIGGVPVAPPIVGGVAVLIAVLAASLPGARWRSWSYVLTDTELIIRYGVVIEIERWLPRTRIQHVDLIGGPIERSLGLRQLVIYTAGTREADVKVPGLPTTTAENLRAELLSWVHPAPDLGGAGDIPSETVDAGPAAGDGDADWGSS